MSKYTEWVSSGRPKNFNELNVLCEKGTGKVLFETLAELANEDVELVIEVFCCALADLRDENVFSLFILDEICVTTNLQEKALQALKGLSDEQANDVVKEALMHWRITDKKVMDGLYENIDGAIGDSFGAIKVLMDLDLPEDELAFGAICASFSEKMSDEQKENLLVHIFENEGFLKTGDANASMRIVNSLWPKSLNESSWRLLVAELSKSILKEPLSEVLKRTVTGLLTKAHEHGLSLNPKMENGKRVFNNEKHPSWLMSIIGSSIEKKVLNCAVKTKDEDSSKGRKRI